MVLVVQEWMVIGHDRSLTKGLKTVNFLVSFHIEMSEDGSGKGFMLVASCWSRSILARG